MGLRRRTAARVAADARDQARRAAESLAMYEVLARAIDRRREVFDVVDGSANADAALEGVQALLGVDELGARAVLDLQLRRLSALERHHISDERDRLRAVVEANGTTPPT